MTATHDRDLAALLSAAVEALNALQTAQADAADVGGRSCAEARHFNGPIRRLEKALARYAPPRPMRTADDRHV